MVNLRESYRADPRKFLDDVLGVDPTDEQVEILESIRDNVYTYVPSYHDSGKTFIAATAAHWFFNAHKPAVVVSTAPTWMQVQEQLWREIRKLATRSKIDLGYEPQTTKVEIEEDHFMIGISPKLENAEYDQGVKGQGFHGASILAILDEGPGIDRRIWDMIMGGWMTSHYVRLLAIGNPTGATGPFYDACKSGDGNVIKMSLFRNPNFVANGIESIDDLRKLIDAPDEVTKRLRIPRPYLATPTWAAGRLKAWGEDSPYFRSRVLSEFPTQGIDELISLAWCQACANAPERSTAEIAKMATKKVLAVDVARFGSDNTCFFGIQHHEQIYKLSYNGVDTMETANRVIALIRSEKYETVVVDADGVGAGVADAVRKNAGSLGLPVVVRDFHGGAKPRKEGDFKNLRSECWWALRELLRLGKLRIQDEGELLSQLTGIKYSYTDKGQIALEKKETMKKRGLESPDEGDALMMAIWGMDLKAITDEPGKHMTTGKPMTTASTPWE